MKKELIYEEVLDMLNNDCDYQSITLSTIAKRCDMGKSTIYEYFTSKDEMIFSSLVYYMKTAIKQFDIRWNSMKLEEALRTYIKILITNMKSNYWMVMPWTFDTFKAYFPEKNRLAVDKLLNDGQNLVIAVLESISRRDDGVLTLGTHENVRFVFFALIGTIASRINNTYDTESNECTELINECINFIFAALK